MNRLLITAAVILSLHVLLRLFGAQTHASVIAGMPQNAASYVLGPLYVLTALASRIAVPILGLAAGFTYCFSRLRRSRTPEQSAPEARSTA